MCAFTHYEWPSISKLFDRRHTPRTTLNLETRLTWQGQYWIGTAVNISPKGLYFVVDGVIPAWVQQPIQVGLVNEAGEPSPLEGLSGAIEGSVSAKGGRWEENVSEGSG